MHKVKFSINRYGYAKLIKIRGAALYAHLKRSFLYIQKNIGRHYWLALGATLNNLKTAISQKYSSKLSFERTSRDTNVFSVITGVFFVLFGIAISVLVGPLESTIFYFIGLTLIVLGGFVNKKNLIN